MPHDHAHHSSSRNLKIAFFLNLGFTILEIAGGFFVNSVAILSDALHDLGDSISLGLAWYLNNKAKKGATAKFTFGYKRFTLLGALINSVVLVGGSVYVIIEAVGRLLVPQHSDAMGMIVFAIIGILVNGYAAWRLRGGKSLNERVVSLHLLEDVLGWVAVLIVSIVLLFKDIHYLDPALSLLITLYILFNVVKRLKETFDIFLLGTPEGIDAEEIKAKLQAIDDVASLHHTHIWSLEGQHHVFTTHLKLTGPSSVEQILRVKKEARAILKSYHFSHYTIDIEPEGEPCDLC